MSSRFDGFTLADLEGQIESASTAIGRLEDEGRAIADQIRPAQDQRARVLSDASSKRSLLAQIREEIERRKAPRPEPGITDHALLRYIERAHGIDMDALRAAILTDAVRTAIQAGAVSVRSNGLVYRITNNSIVTIFGEGREQDRPKAGRLTRAQRERLEDDDTVLDEDVWAYQEPSEDGATDLNAGVV